MMKRITKVALATRLGLFFLAHVAHSLVRSWDTSSTLVHASHSLSRADHWLWSAFLPYLRWDAVYFHHIALYGYTHEQHHAFFPLLPLLTRFLGRVGLWMGLDAWVSPESLYLGIGVLLSNMAFVLAARQLYRLTLALFNTYGTVTPVAAPNHRQRRQHVQFAYLTATLFCFNPGAMFTASMYTESLFAYLSWSGMTAWVESRKWTAALWFGLASLCRGNGVLYAGFFAYDGLMEVARPLLIHGRDRGAVPGRWWNVGRVMLVSIVGIMVSLSGFIAFQYYGYSEFCTRQTRPWCSRTIPLLYSFVQEHYWNNGFLKYYEIKQIPNFILAVPMVLLSVSGLREYAGHMGEVDKSPYYTFKVVPMMVLWAVMLWVAVTSMHVQVVTRFFTSVPCVFWYGAHVLLQGDQRKSNALLTYFIIYGVATTCTFSLFYPPA